MKNKGPDNLFLILSILAAGLIVAGALVYVKTVQSPSGPPAAGPAAPAAMSKPFAEQILIPDSLRACNAGDRCIVVDTTCSFCCKYTPINAAHEQDFNKMFDNACRAYKGETCNCFDLNSYPSCVDGQCQMVTFDQKKLKKFQTQKNKSALPKVQTSVRPDAQLMPGGVEALKPPAAAKTSPATTPVPPPPLPVKTETEESTPFPELPPDAKPPSQQTPEKFPLLPQEGLPESDVPVDAFGDNADNPNPGPSL